MDKSRIHHDYCTYASVVSSTTARMLLALAVWHGWYIWQAIAAVAFFNGLLRDTVYMGYLMGFKQRKSYNPAGIDLIQYGFAQHQMTGGSPSSQNIRSRKTHNPIDL